MKQKRKIFDYKLFLRRMERAGIKQVEIAQVAGTTAPHVSRILSGRTKSPWIAPDLWDALELLEKQGR